MTDIVSSLLDFIDRSPSPYHCVTTMKARLEAEGYTPLPEREAWSLELGGKYYLERGGKTLAAFRIGERAPAQSGCRLIVAHSDSPVLKIRPRPGFKARDAAMLNADIYGSPLLHTWLDRDLKVVGAVYDKNGPVEVEIPSLRVRANSLAPHLKSEKRTERVTVDRQNDLKLTFSQTEGDIIEQLNSLLMDASGTSAAPLSYDLCLADTQPSSLVGADNEFISAPRLDNLFSSFCAFETLLSANVGPQTQIAVMFDAEEIGSGTWTGARSNFLEMLLARLDAAFSANRDDIFRLKANSMIISADMAHSEHPSFIDATDRDHVPSINGGLAVKSSTSANYAIGHGAEAWFKAICQEAGLSLQHFKYRCDHGGGSSVGPYTTTALGINGIDVGAPLLAMHSIREMAGAQDVPHTISAFRAFFETNEIPDL